MMRSLVHLGGVVMTRSSYIYMAIPQGTCIPVLACTVMREFIEQVQEHEFTGSDYYFIRLRDNIPYSDTALTRLELDLAGR